LIRPERKCLCGCRRPVHRKDGILTARLRGIGKFHPGRGCRYPCSPLGGCGLNGRLAGEGGAGRARHTAADYRSSPFPCLSENESLHSSNPSWLCAVQRGRGGYFCCVVAEGLYLCDETHVNTTTTNTRVVSGLMQCVPYAVLYPLAATPGRQEPWGQDRLTA